MYKAAIFVDACRGRSVTGLLRRQFRERSRAINPPAPGRSNNPNDNDDDDDDRSRGREPHSLRRRESLLPSFLLYDHFRNCASRGLRVSGQFAFAADIVRGTMMIVENLRPPDENARVSIRDAGRYMARYRRDDASENGARYRSNERNNRARRPFDTPSRISR